MRMPECDSPGKSQNISQRDQAQPGSLLAPCTPHSVGGTVVMGLSAQMSPLRRGGCQWVTLPAPCHPHSPGTPRLSHCLCQNSALGPNGGDNGGHLWVLGTAYARGTRLWHVQPADVARALLPAVELVLTPLPAVTKAAWHLPRVYLDTPEPAADIFFICFLSGFMPFW